MTIYAYARVSTKSQSLERQVNNILRAYPDIQEKNIYRESFTGTTLERPEFKKVIKKLKPGDKLVMDSVSRFSRTATEGFELYTDLYSKGIDLEFLKEPYVNTEMYREAMSVKLPAVDDSCLKPLMQGIEETLMLLAKKQFLQAFEQSEKEVQDIRQRTKEGMKASGAGEKISKAHKGKTYNVKKREDAIKKILKYSKTFGGSLNDKELMQLIGCSHNTLYSYKRYIKSL